MRSLWHIILIGFFMPVCAMQLPAGVANQPQAGAAVPPIQVAVAIQQNQRPMNGPDILQRLLGVNAHYDNLHRRREVRKNWMTLGSSLVVGALVGRRCFPKLVSALQPVSFLSSFGKKLFAHAGSIGCGVLAFAAGWTFLHYLGDFLHINPVLHWAATRNINREINETEENLEKGVSGKDKGPAITIQDLQTMENQLAGDVIAQQHENKRLTDLKLALLKDLATKAAFAACKS